MPSVFAKVEKQNSLEIQDPLKQVQSLVEKKIRNLEKRKGKLEQLKEEQESGKALHDDQKKAVKRFEEVTEMLDFFKEFHKNVGSIYAEHSKQVKKNNKREQLERQQQEVEKLKTVILFQDLLNGMGTDETRSDFLKGTNGALQLNEEKLIQLDELYKLVNPDRSKNDESFSKQLDNAGERWMALVEGKNREAIKGCTYKDLKELLMSISSCGYFDTGAKTEIKDEKIGQGGDVPSSVADKTQEVSLANSIPSSNTLNNDVQQDAEKYQQLASGAKAKGAVMNNLVGQMSESQSVSSGFNFLQESRLEMETNPHMDPAVVAMAPVAGTYANQYASGTINAQSAEALASQLASAIPLSATQKAASTYDTINSHQPIPTQTFTNQNFAAMMTTFVPAVTIASSGSMALGLPVQHIPVQNISPHHTTPSPDMITVQDPSQQSQQQQLMTQQLQQQQHGVPSYQDSNYSNYQPVDSRTDTNLTSQDNAPNYVEEGIGFGHNQGIGQGYRNYRGRGGRGSGRGTSMNGHSIRGRSSRGGYQSSFSNNGYNNNANGPYYGNNEKRNATPGSKGAPGGGNRAGGRSAAGPNRNQGGNYGTK